MPGPQNVPKLYFQSQILMSKTNGFKKKIIEPRRALQPKGTQWFLQIGLFVDPKVVGLFVKNIINIGDLFLIKDNRL